MTAPAAVSAPERGAPCGVAGAAAAVFSRARPRAGHAPAAGWLARAAFVPPPILCFFVSSCPLSPFPGQ